MKKLIFTILFVFCVAISFGQNRIRHNGQDLFLNGMNLAWIDFANDLTAFDEAAFTTAVSEISAEGGNSIRWWLHTNGASSPYFSNDSVLRITDNEILALNKALDIAYNYNMGLILCLWSFDMLSSSNSDIVKRRNRLMLTDSLYMQAYINNALIPMLEIVGDHPAVICWEIFNEPEGMTLEYGWSGVDKVSINDVQTFINRTAGAIHRNTDSAKVSNGSWSFEASTDIGGGNTNYYTDARLIAQGGDPDGYLDFYMVHYYDWAGTTGSPFHYPASYWNLDKPLVIGEFAANGPISGIDTQSAYDSLITNGYAGGLTWQYNGEEMGGLPAAALALNYIATNFPDEVNIDYPVIVFNNYPEVVKEISDTNVAMGSSLSGPYINLKDVFTDVEDSVFLSFSISFNTNPDLVTASIDVDSNLILEISSGASGVAEIHVKGTDSGKKFAVSKFSVYVFDADGLNKALFRKAWASSMESSLLLPGNVVDNSMTTRWSSLYNDDEWIAVDMGQEYTVECVDLQWEAAHGTEYEIQVASDTANWQTVFYQVDGDGGRDIANFAPSTCRYVRMYGITRNAQWGFSLYELGVYEDSIIIIIPPNAYSPITSTGEITIYPVPFDNEFTVQSVEGNAITKIEVFNLNSTLMESFSYNTGVTVANISIPDIQSGMYYVVIYSDQSVIVRKVLKF